MKRRAFAVLWFLPMLLLMARASRAEDGKGFRPEGPMTNARLEQILRIVEPSVRGGGGRWEMIRDEVRLVILSDEAHNRMRVIAPVVEVKQLDQQTLMRMMEANFSTALDARYAVFQGTVWAAFLHPLDSLRERDFISGLQQVTTLVKTTGTTYSSSDLRFGPSYQGK